MLVFLLDARLTQVDSRRPGKAGLFLGRTLSKWARLKSYKPFKVVQMAKLMERISCKV